MLSYRKQKKNNSGDFPFCEIEVVILLPFFADTCGCKASKFWKRLENDITEG